MRHDPSLLQQVREALRQAARSLQDLKMLSAERDPDIARLMEELRSAIPNHEEGIHSTAGRDELRV